METSGIANLAKAVSAAFADMGNVAKDADNPFFNSSYASLGGMLDHVRPKLAAHGLSVVQMPGLTTVADGTVMATLTTVLMHSSGENLTSTASAPVVPSYDKKSGASYVTAQGCGSAWSYLRRYSLAAFTAIAQVDDDGNAASAPPNKSTANATSKDDLIVFIRGAVDLKELKALEDAVKDSGDQEVVDAYTAHRRELKRSDSKKAA